jgi:hypothetical protein
LNRAVERHKGDEGKTKKHHTIALNLKKKTKTKVTQIKQKGFKLILDSPWVEC